MSDFQDIEKDYDVIFCRNVLIYFDRATQEQVVKKLVSKIQPGGYLLIGHSESIYHMDLPLTQLRPTIFQKNL
jgi:chemotaxis protein methyltransferase CheR